MLENIRYTNHLGETVKFDGSENIYAAHGELRDYSWNYSTSNDVLSDFNNRGIVEKSLPVKIFGTDEESKAARNRLYEITDKDTTANQQGALWFDDYYMKCYVSASSKSRYMPDSAQINLTLVTDSPYWIKENTQNFMPAESQAGLKYLEKYNYRYVDYNVRKTVTNTNLAPMPFKLIIYGPCDSPEIIIGASHYKINVQVAATEYLTLTAIDKEKTIFLTNAYGIKTNVFNKREKSFDVFSPIPNGTFDVTWNGNFNFDLTVLDRRSEPPWT